MTEQVQVPEEGSGEQFNQAVSACLQHQRELALDDLLRRSLFALLGLSIIAFAFGYAMAGRVLSPLGRITRTARQVAGSDLSRRIELDGPDDELKELADTFDEMLDRLERAFTAQQRFVANASHELRTPLAINRTLLEVHLSDPGAPVELQQLGKTLLATNERSEQLVEGLLLLARSDRGLEHEEPVRLDDVARGVLDSRRHAAEQAGVRLEAELSPQVVSGDPVLLERLVVNLVDNAITYNQQGGLVSVRTGGDSALQVCNTGPDVPADQVGWLFEPFRQLRKQRSGSGRGVGLGLSIVASIAKALGGSVRAVPRPGGGLEMAFSVP